MAPWWRDGRKRLWQGGWLVVWKYNEEKQRTEEERRMTKEARKDDLEEWVMQ